VQRTLRRVDVWSVFKLSIFYYTCFIVLWLGVVAILYQLLASAGLFDALQKFGKAMVLWKNVDITLGYVEKWALLLGIVFLVLGSLINALIAFLYNVAADTVGGIELTFIEKEAGPRSSGTSEAR
jgi:ABC-type phosphate transport system permease subunit